MARLQEEGRFSAASRAAITSPQYTGRTYTIPAYTIPAYTTPTVGQEYQLPPDDPRLYDGIDASDVNCDSFDTQADAQDFYDSESPDDPYVLDGDGDGTACETLPP
jgi:micrococcal nuclease